MYCDWLTQVTVKFGDKSLKGQYMYTTVLHRFYLLYSDPCNCVLCMWNSVNNLDRSTHKQTSTKTLTLHKYVLDQSATLLVPAGKNSTVFSGLVRPGVHILIRYHLGSPLFVLGGNFGLRFHSSISTTTSWVGGREGGREGRMTSIMVGTEYTHYW